MTLEEMKTATEVLERADLERRAKYGAYVPIEMTDEFLKHFYKSKGYRDFIISANYPFWKHPIRWIRERKLRKIMEKIVQYKWNNGGKEEVEEQVKNVIIQGL